MTTRVFCAAAACLLTGTAAFAQLPAPTGPAPTKGGFASGSDVPPPKPASGGSSPPAFAPLSPPAIVELPNATPIGVPYKGGPCQKCNQEPCVPEFKPKTRVLYSTVCREYCLPERSFIDLILAKCGLDDECDEAEGVKHSKTLLVKKVVPKCEPAPCAPVNAAMMLPPPPRISVYPTRP
jgi:hypothetical protein